MTHMCACAWCAEHYRGVSFWLDAYKPVRACVGCAPRTPRVLFVDRSLEFIVFKNIFFVHVCSERLFFCTFLLLLQVKLRLRDLIGAYRACVGHHAF